MRFMMVVIRKGYEIAAAQRGYRRLLDHSRAFAGRGARMGQASTDGQQRDHRCAPNLREGRFLHSRAESSRRLRGAFERGCGKGVSDIQE